MKYLPKDAHKLPTAELVKHLFPKDALAKIKADAEKPAPKPKKIS